MEPVSIVGFSFGALGFLLTVRNGVEKILVDKDKFKNFSKILVPLICELASLTSFIDHWKTYWHIQDGTPDSLFLAYWGVDGAEKIKNLLTHIQSTSNELHDQFESVYARELRAVRRDSPSAPNGGQFDTSRIQKLKKAGSNSKAYLYTLMTDSIFQIHLQKLKKDIEVLKELSENLFITHARHNNRNHWEGIKESFALQNRLVRLAQSAAIESRSLEPVCTHPRAVYVDLRLDRNTTADVRMDAIYSHLRDDMLPFYMVAHQLDNDVAINVCVQVMKQISFSELWAPDLYHAVERLCKPETSPGAKIYFKDSQSNSVFMANRTDVAITTTESLRCFLAAAKNKNRFRRSERVQLGYELAEYALLLLRTNWLSDICGCCVRRAQGFNTQYAVRFGQIEHLDPTTGTRVPEKQWCEADWRRMHIRRIGVLLAEIAIGANVLAAKLDEETDSVQIDFGSGFEDDIYKNIDAILARVEDEAGYDWRDAIKHCLGQGLTPADVGLSDLDMFFIKVVNP
jgi:hypothetical protein